MNSELFLYVAKWYIDIYFAPKLHAKIDNRLEGEAAGAARKLEEMHREDLKSKESGFITVNS